MEPEPDIQPARIGGFRVLRRLSSGATTDVLLARAEGPHGFERVVALKVLLQQFQSDPSFERMFAREASAYARLSHPAIVKLFDFFSTDGQLVMVLEYVDGLPLHKLRAMLSIGGERFEDSAALFIGSRIFAALGAAHSARDPENGEFAPVIHRDVNPSNVLVPWDGHVKIADFGIAKIGAKQGDTHLGFIKGTYGYMAPEQVRGENVTVRADVYAAALLLWELLARRKAIQRGALPEVEVLKAMAKPEIPSLDVLRPDLPAEVREAVRRGLEPNPDRRAITADEMAGILRHAMGGDEGRAMLAEAIARVRPPPSEGRLAVTSAHPSLADTMKRDPDETTRIAASAVPEDSGAFKRSEIEVVRTPSERVEEAPESSGDLTMVEARKPLTSEPPPTLPPSSEPSTLSPSTLPLPHSDSASDWREPAQGFVRTNPVAEQPSTLRFGPSDPPPTTQDPPPAPAVPPLPPLPSPAVVPPSTPLGKVTLISAVPPPPPSRPPASRPPPSRPPASRPSAARPAPEPPAPPPPPPSPSPPSPSPPPPPPPAPPASPRATPVPEATVEPSLPRFPMPSEADVPVPVPLPMPVTERGVAAGRPTIRTVRRSSGVGVIVGVVLGSALFGIGGVELYLRLRSPTEGSSPGPIAATVTAPARPVASAPPAARPPPAPAPSAVPAATAAASAPPRPSAAPTVAAPASATASAVAAVAAPAGGADPKSMPAGSDAPAAAAGMGDILTKASAGGHRIFVDDRVVGNSPDPVRVRCGRHDVRIGSAGTPRDVDVPCGGSVVVNP